MSFIYWCSKCFHLFEVLFVATFRSLLSKTQNGCRFLTSEFTAGSVSVYWLLIVFVVAAGFTNCSARSLVIHVVFMCMSSFWLFISFCFKAHALNSFFVSCSSVSLLYCCITGICCLLQTACVLGCSEGSALQVHLYL